MLVRYRCANLFFLVLPNELFREAEVPLGWGALVEGDGALRIGAQTRLARNTGRKMRLRFLHRIAVAGTRQFNRQLGITLRGDAGRARRNSASRSSPHEKIVSGHFLRLRQAEQKEQGRRDIRQDSVLNVKLFRVIRDVNEVDQVRGVRGVRRSIRIAHLFAIAVVGRDQSIFRLATRAAGTIRATQSSIVSTALIPAATTPVCPTMSGLAKFRMIRS